MDIEYDQNSRASLLHRASKCRKEAQGLIEMAETLEARARARYESSHSTLATRQGQLFIQAEALHKEPFGDGSLSMSSSPA